MKIYVACGLTHVPRDMFEEYTSFIHRMAAALRSQSVGREVRYALVDSDPQLAAKPFDERARLCYLWDREMVEAADLVIAEATFPSTGLGIELQIAQQMATPIILCFRDSDRTKAAPVQYVNPDASKHSLQIGEGLVTLMALGIPGIVRAVRYGSFDDGLRQVLEATAMIDR